MIPPACHAGRPKKFMERDRMERPFVVCHMLTSLDGKIDGAFFHTPETAPALNAYGQLRGFYGCQATLYGTTTMLGGYADGEVPALPPAHTPLLRKDWVNAEGRALGNFIVSMDPQGILSFSSHILEKKGRPAAHVIEVLTEQAAPEYLAYLQKQGVSYIVAGKKRVDCALLLHKLRTVFGIDTLMVAGGGITNWSFLQDDLIDELSLVIAPVADGSADSASIFEQAAFLPVRPPQAFTLIEVKVLDGDTLWLRYHLRH